MMRAIIDEMWVVESKVCNTTALKRSIRVSAVYIWRSLCHEELYTWNLFNANVQVTNVMFKPFAFRQVNIVTIK